MTIAELYEKALASGDIHTTKSLKYTFYAEIDGYIVNWSYGMGYVNLAIYSFGSIIEETILYV